MSYVQTPFDCAFAYVHFCYNSRNMHRNIVLCATLLSYYGIAFFGLYIFDAQILATALVLFGIPACIFARFSAAPTLLLITVTLFGFVLTIFLEGIAHMYGLWYSLGVEELKFFGLVPLEAIIASSTQILFLVLLYEFLFDDGEYSIAHVRTRYISLGVFFVSTLSLFVLHLYVLRAIFVPYSYLWILGILSFSTLAILATHRGLTIRFFDRLSLFTLCASVPLGIGTVLAVVNTQKIFASTHEYVFSFTILGSRVPLEEICLIFVIPLFVATFYEIYLDDGRV